MSNPKPLLDTEETNVQNPLPSSYKRYKLEKYAAEYEATLEAYLSFNDPDSDKKAENLRGCSSHAYFTRHCHTGQVRVIATSCRLRWCPICSNRKRAYMSRAVEAWITSRKHPKFVTFTLSHSDTPLIEQIEKLYGCWRKFKRRSFFKKHFQGGVWFFQCHKSDTDSLWHPHLHVCTCGPFIQVPRLSNEWRKCTKDSFIVDVRSISNAQKAGEYVARYASRPGNLSDHCVSDQQELICAMFNRRICGQWGAARGLKLTPPKIEDKDLWHRIGYWSTVVGLKNTDRAARQILKSWFTHEPLDDGVNMNHIDVSSGLDNAFDRLKKRKPDLQTYLDIY